MVVSKCWLLQTIIFLLCVSFPPIFSTTSHARPIQLGNETDRLALLAFKDQLLYDPMQALSSWNESTHFCEWDGVTCGRRHQRVVLLNLSSRGLVGPVSPFIGNLSFLRQLRLANNTFQGNIPQEISHLFRLNFLSLYNNSLVGKIPANLVQCSNLIYLSLSDNRLVGEIPSEFGSFTKLLWLNVFSNNLTGRIPVALGNISSLQHLDASYNQLAGSIPDSLGQLKELTFLHLGSNMLSGMLPPSLYNLSSLQIVDFDTNQLQGSLPTTIGRDFPNLREFYINENKFSGTLPVSLFSNASRLSVLSVGDNQLDGSIPESIGELKELTYLDLGLNMLSGMLPPSLYNLSSLQIVDFDTNQLQGSLPPSIGRDFPNLRELYIGVNQFSGTLPVSLFSNASRLSALSVGGNQLDGSIPDSIGELKELTYLDVGPNMLSGMLPPSLYNLSSLQTVDFVNNQFQGSLPPSIGRDFPNLRTFIIAGNQFTGTFPVSLFSNASRLSILDVSGNIFVGQIPIEMGNLKEITTLGFGYNQFGSGGIKNDLAFISSLSNCSNLKILRLQFNKFGGKLPASLTNLSITINQLFLSDNQIFGSIPFGISKLKNLFSLDLSSNSLTGTIPKEIGMLQNLQYLGLGHNRLTGKIPNIIGNITPLYELHLEYNMLQGNIEPSLEKCRSLQMLFLNNNRFTGSLPKQILGVSINLLKVDLSNNYLNGSLPQEVGQLKSLQYLDLSGNKISGEIPTTLGSCSSLTELDLSDNSLQGLIPSTFGDLVAIEIIDLSQNKLSGKFPRTLENLRYLKYLNVSFNQFEGEVPSKGIFQNVTGFSIIENDKLCGGSSELKLHKCHINKSKQNKFPLALKVTIGVLVSLSAISTLLVLRAIYLRKKSSVKSLSKKHANELQRISYNEIREATNGFLSSNLIGVGRFASVYKGVLREGGSVIAVKVFNLTEIYASKSFKAECEILRKIRHRNLLKILTVCSSVDFDGNDFKAIILEFMPYGSLEDWLHTSSDRSKRSSMMLNLLQRLNIAVDIASALDYLHNGSHTPIVHCDLKPSNVLLNQDLVARVGDFGLAKFLSESHNSLDKSETNSTTVRGTVGYIPPEYGMGAAVSTKGDVYSYGIMLLEMFTGRRPTDEMFNDNMNLHNFCKVKLDEQHVDMVNIIPLLEQFQNDTKEGRSMSRSMGKCVLSIIEIGVACSSEAVGDRMEIKDVLMKIQKIKEIFLKSMNLSVNTNMELNM